MSDEFKAALRSRLFQIRRAQFGLDTPPAVPVAFDAAAAAQQLAALDPVLASSGISPAMLGTTGNTVSTTGAAVSSGNTSQAAPPVWYKTYELPLLVSVCGLAAVALMAQRK